MDDRTGNGLRAERFHFGERQFDAATGTLYLHYALDDRPLVEEFRFPVSPLGPGSLPDAAFDLLQWVAGISYWKTACPPRVTFADRSPDAWQRDWLRRLYREGLAEFAWVNNLDPATWELFAGGSARRAEPAAAGHLADRALVPLGGGKDSLVALERVRAAGVEAATVAVGRAPLITRTAEHTGLPHLSIERRLDPGLAELNRAGAWNGHVPVTAINAAAMVILALMTRCRWVVFANERSADQPTRHDARGRPVNHQFSKSFGFECMLDDWVRHYIAGDLHVFSLLRRDREVAICREFAGLVRYHEVFSSCNRNFHLDGPRTGRWCGNCPKCHFVYLSLAAFMPPPALAAIFGADLLDDAGLLPGFRALLDLDHDKPFECVGDAGESRALVVRLAMHPDWSGHAVIRALAPLLSGVEVPDFDPLLVPVGEHRIPGRFR